MLARALAPLLDLAALLTFAIIGRRSHEHGLTVSGVIDTATPFVCGTAAGYLLASMALGAPPRSLQFGAVVVASAVIIGMLIRRVTGDGTAMSFIVVATIFLSVTMLGWRLVATWLS